jgi:ornithine carbamoyltransferase
MKRDLLSLQDLSTKEILDLFTLTDKIKKNPRRAPQVLKGKTLGLVFQKPSNRTRVSFEVGINELGGQAIYLGPGEINLGVRESTSDVSQTLSRYLDGIIARTHRHTDIVDLAKYSTVPVINGLSDMFHPCQALADLYSIREKFGKLKGYKIAYIGDGNNNVCHSLLLGASKTGVHMSIASPKGYEPQTQILKIAAEYSHQSGSKIQLAQSPQEAAQNADVIYSDVWVSMGQEEESAKRLKDFQGFQINAELVKNAKKNYLFMHCLPAHRGEEVTVDVIDGKNSIVFDQAENRLHTQKAVLIFLFNHFKKSQTRGSKK